MFVSAETSRLPNICAGENASVQTCPERPNNLLCHDGRAAKERDVQGSSHALVTAIPCRCVSSMTISLFPRASSASEAKEPWSAFLTGMVASLKPSARQSTSTQPATSATDSQAATIDSLSSSRQSPTDVGSDQTVSPSSSTTTRSVRTNNEHDDDLHRASKRRKLRGSSPASLATPRPPTKLTQKHPDSGPVSITNGVTSEANNEQVETSTGEKKGDKRALRSHDDVPRLKCELAVYFPNYDDIISGQQGHTSM